jgi:hypothetical protein
MFQNIWLAIIIARECPTLYRLLVDEKGSDDRKKTVSDGFEGGPLKQLYLR